MPPKTINPVIVTDELKLSSRELNALAKVIDLAWLSVESQPADSLRLGSKDQRSVWAAAGALNKIRKHLKGFK